MTAFCDKCEKNDHESCIRLIGNLRLCRTCQLNDPEFDCVFGCSCGEWIHKVVESMLDDAESNFIKCPSCAESIRCIYPEEERFRVVFCDCGDWEPEKTEKIKPLIGAFCNHCKGQIRERIETQEWRDLLSRVKNKSQPSDPVNHPAHYKSGGMEAIDVIEAFKLGFPLGNAVKYILRAGKKNDGLQDLQKAAWYIQHEIKKIIESHAFKRGK